MGYYEFPHTRNYDTDLGWVIKKINELDALLNSIDIKDLTTDVDALMKDNDTNKANISTNTDDIKTNSDNIDVLTKKVEVNTTNINTNTANITNHSTRIATLENESKIPGPQGPQGEQGPRGPQGIQGAQGVNGLNGADGKSFTILALYSTLLELQTAHPVGEAGQAYAVGTIANNTIYIWDVEKTAWTDLGKMQGPQGPQGIQGPQGPQGIQGATGPKGPIGLTGPQGPKGEQGPQGETGPQGPPGETPSLANYYTITQVNSMLKAKQDLLVSGTNIKSINSASLLGEGNIDLATMAQVNEAINNAIGTAINGTY